MGGRQRRDIRRRKEGYYDDQEDQYRPSSSTDNRRPTQLGDYAPRQTQNQGQSEMAYKVFKANMAKQCFEYVCTLNGERPQKSYIHNKFGEGVYVVIDQNKQAIWFDFLSEENRQKQRRQSE